MSTKHVSVTFCWRARLLGTSGYYGTLQRVPLVSVVIGLRCIGYLCYLVFGAQANFVGVRLPPETVSALLNSTAHVPKNCVYTAKTQAAVLTIDPRA